MRTAFKPWLQFLILGLLTVPAGLPVRAQPTPDSASTDTVANRNVGLESVLDDYGADEHSTQQLSEQFTALFENPLSLNDASASDLATLAGVSSGQAHRIVKYRSSSAPFHRLSEITEVKGVTSTTVRSMRPYVKVQVPTQSGTFPSLETLLSGLELNITQRFSRRLETSRGFREQQFLGSPGRLTTRIHLHHGRRLEASLTLDKDPGEPVRWTPETDTYAFDHVVGSVALNDLSFVETLVVGHFSAQFGQGVAIWQGIRFGKGRDPVSPVLRSGRGLLPYRSASEAGYFRGLGTTIDLPGNLFASAFASQRRRDASPDTIRTSPGTSQPAVFARTVSASGQHRTPREIARKNTFAETTVGGALEHRSPNLHVGAAGYFAQFDLPLHPENRPYRQFRTTGRSTFMASVYGTAYLNDYIVFGEAARAANGAVGGVVGAALDRGDRLQAVLLGRYYPYDFPNFHGNSFGDSGHPQNETGIYTGLQVQFAEHWRLGAYYDQFRAPWLRYNVPLPSTGTEGRIVLTYTPRPWLSSYVQGRIQTDEEGTTTLGPGGRRLETTQVERRYSLRWHSEYSFSDALSLRTRTQLSRYSTEESRSLGVFLSAGLHVRPISSLRVDVQTAIFHTDDYAARIYAYERDLRYSFSVPVFFDQGRRSYVLVQYDAGPSLTIEAKYGTTRYAHRTTIGSGLNRIVGPQKQEIGVQIRWEL